MSPSAFAGGSRPSGGDSGFPTPRVGPTPAPLPAWESSPGGLATPFPPLTPARPADVPGDDSSTDVGAPTSTGGDPPEVALARTDPRKRFGHFVLLQEIGKGGMGVVYRAWNERLRRTAALKMILPFSDEAEASVRRFHREAEAVARLRHPNIVSVHEAGELEGKHYLAMDYVPGTSLERRLAEKQDGKKRIARTKAIEVVRDVARAVEHAHENGVIHRDLKPANIMLDGEDRPFVLDFGLAAIRGATSGLTRSGARVGTPAYMPPEQANSAGDRIDERSDVYGLGATLYHVLTGGPPFQGATEYNVLAAVLMKDPTPPSKVAPGVAADLDTIALKCLEKEPGKRYASAAAVADELDRFLAGDPIEARPVGALSRVFRRARRNKLSASLALLAFLLLGALAAAGVRLEIERGEASAKQAREDEERERARRDLEEHAREVASALAAIEKGGLDAASRERAVLSLERHAEPKTVELLGQALDARSARLLAATRAVYAAALEPTDDEKRAGLEPIAGLLPALDAKLALAPGAEVGEGSKKPLALAEDRLVERASRDKVQHGMASPTVLRLIAAGQASALSPGDVEVAKVACDALGKIGGAAAVPALGRYLFAEADQIRAVPAGIALCRIGGADAERLVLASRGRFGVDEPYWHQVRPFFQRSAATKEAPASTPRELCARGRTRCDRGDIEGGIADFTRAIELDPRFTDAYVIRGAVRHEKGDLDGALADLTRAIELSPECASAYNNRGNVKIAKDDRDGAIEDFARATELDPKDATAWENHGSALVRKGELETARSDFERALAIDASSSGAWMGLGRVRHHSGDLDGAIAAYSRALELDPRRAEAWSNRGISRYKKGELEDALADLSRALELDGKLARTWYFHGRVRWRLGAVEAAIEDFTHAVELDPKDGDAWGARGNALGSRGDADGALADLTKAVELLPKDAGFWNDRGNARDAKGDTEGAIADYTRALEIEPDLGELWYSRGRKRLDKDDAAGAIADLTRAIELKPELKQAWHKRGLARRAQGDAKTALADFSRALELDASYALAWNSRGVLRHESGDLDGAIADLTRAVELEPRYAPAWNNRATTRTDKGDLDGAIADATRGLELDPRSVSAWNTRGNAKAKKGDHEGAIADLTRAIEVDPSRKEPFVNRGSSRSKRGDAEGALADWARALELDPKLKDVLALRAELRVERGEIDAALADLARALDIDASYARALYLRGEARRRKGDRAGMEADWKRFLELEPRGEEADEVRKALAVER